jgi:hypothetical protein
MAAFREPERETASIPAMDSSAISPLETEIRDPQACGVVAHDALDVRLLEGRDRPAGSLSVPW